MNKYLKKDHLVRVVTMVACLAMFPTWLCGQNNRKEKTKYEDNDWTKKDLENAGERLKDVIKWQDTIDKYWAEKSILDSLKEEAEKKNKELGNLRTQLEETKKMLRENCADMQENGGFEKLYKQYDTILLLQVQSHLDDKSSEQIVRDLLACHRAEALLFVPYDSCRVGKASETLKSMDSNGKVTFIPKLTSRLDGYQEMTDKLRDTLMTVNTTSSCKCNKNDSFVIKDKVKNAVFERMGRLDSALFNPHDYPFLHGIFVEALEIKNDDPSNDLQELIDKLRKHQP